MDIVWQLDPKEGSANYSVSIEKRRSQPLQGDLFAPPKPTKKDLFRELLSEQILQGQIVNNFQAFEFCIRQSHPVSQAHDILMELKKTKKIYFEGRSPKIRFMYYRDRHIYDIGKVDFIIL